jgi:uncharacterized membrane protein YGL010W
MLILCLVLALICFILAALGVAARVNLLAVGLACATLGWILQAYYPLR